MATTTRKTTTRKKKENTILESVNNLQPQAVIEEIGALQNTLQSTLAGLSAQITSKVEQMNNVDTAIAAKSQELTELYEIEKEAQILDDVRARRDEIDEEWNKKVSARQLEWSEEEEEREKAFKRKEEEHAYMHSQRVKRSQEEYNAEISEKRRNELIRVQELERQWKEREESIVEKEQEFVSLKAEVDGFGDKLKAEVAKAEAIVGNRVKKDYEHQIAMFQKDMDAERNLNATKVSALDDTINKLEDQIDDLQAQLKAALQDAKEVTNAALQSASGRTAMQAMQQFVDSGHQSSSKSK